MIRYCFFLWFLLPISVYADVTLRCQANTKCDAYLKNCTVEPYNLTVNIDPKKEIVTVGSTNIKADFSNPAVVDFNWLEYTVSINKNEYSATLFNKTGVRYGGCVAITPAW